MADWDIDITSSDDLDDESDVESNVDLDVEVDHEDDNNNKVDPTVEESDAWLVREVMRELDHDDAEDDVAGDFCKLSHKDVDLGHFSVLKVSP